MKRSPDTFLLSLLLSIFSFICLSPACYSQDQSVIQSEHTAAQEVEQPGGAILKKVNSVIYAVLLFDITAGSIQIPEVDRRGNLQRDEQGNKKMRTVGIPFLVAILFFGAIFFSFFFSFVNIRAFKHAIEVVCGKYDKEEDQGEITHFRALTSALSATIGLGNIAGVAVAIQTGGPGAVFWMLVCAVFGMSAKFSSCTLAQLYRKIRENGTVAGGPMYYLDIGLAERGGFFKPFGKVLAVMYAFMVMGGALGGGNMFQANQTAEAFQNTFGFSEQSGFTIGLIMAVAVGAVILGGIKRIGAATSRIVPLMCITYVLASLIVILTNIHALPEAMATIVRLAFSENAFFGGIVGVMVTGITRASFSNEAGLGSAAIAHAAAKTDEPVREGMVAMLGPFIDTIIVCFMTSMVIVITGVWDNPEIAAHGGNLGVSLTAEAFRTVLPWFPYVLTICIAFFAYSTMIAWCYYGEVGWTYLLDHFGGRGKDTVFIFRIIFICFVVYGAVNKLADVIDFTDAMILSMAFPNILGSMLLAPKVRAKLKDYMRRLKSGEMQRA